MRNPPRNVLRKVLLGVEKREGWFHRWVDPRPGEVEEERATAVALCENRNGEVFRVSIMYGYEMKFKVDD